MTDNCGIYKIVNTVTGDFYVGSAVNLRKRWSQHKSTLIANCHKNAHLQRAWNKYGADCFTFEAVLYCDKEHLLEREQFHIDNDKPSYNIAPTAGSNLGRKFSDETKRNMSEAHKGKVLTEETKQRLSEALTGERNAMFGKCGERHPLFGIHLSDETKQKISEAEKGERNHGFGKHHTDKTKQKISEAQKGEFNHNFGKHPTEETKQRISEALSGENNHNFGKPGTMLGLKATEETCAKMSEAQHRRWQREALAHLGGIS